MNSQEFEFEIGALLPIGLTILVLAIALAFGLQVMGEIQDDMVVANVPRCEANTTVGTIGTLYYDNCSYEYNANREGITAVGKIPDKIPLLVTVVIAAVIICIIVTYLMVRLK
jgi:hypothetical protein